MIKPVLIVYVPIDLNDLGVEELERHRREQAIKVVSKSKLKSEEGT